MSMDSLVFGTIRPPPASCDERGKRLKLDAEPESESESKQQPEEESKLESKQEPLEEEPEEKSKSESESESESEPETKSKLKRIPPFDWNAKPIEEFVRSDFSSLYDDDPYGFCFIGPNFTYKNPAYLKKEEDTEKAVTEYMERKRNISPYDAIPVPPLANECGNNFPRPISITEDRIPLFTRFSQLALEDYNAKNQDHKYQFDKFVKATRRRIPLTTYYITFEAKQIDNASNVDPSNCPSATFQAQVWDKITGDPEIKESCLSHCIHLM